MASSWSHEDVERANDAGVVEALELRLDLAGEMAFDDERLQRSERICEAPG
jgi:hypothetical protein